MSRIRPKDDILEELASAMNKGIGIVGIVDGLKQGVVRVVLLSPEALQKVLFVKS